MEEPLRLNSRRLAVVALMLYAISILIIILGLIIAIGIIVSSLPPISIPEVPITAEVARSIAGLVLIGIGFLFYIIFVLYTGFKGARVVSRVDLAGWEGVIKNMGKLYFIAILFIVIGILIIPGTSRLYKDCTMLLVTSILFMASSLLIPSPQRSIAAGILLTIAAIFSSLIGRVSIPSLGEFANVPVLGQISQLISAIFISGVLSAVALIIVGIALIIRGILLRWPISHIIAVIGGIIFTSGLAYAALSFVSFLSGLPSPTGFLPEPIASAYWTLYSTAITGSSLLGIAGILGIISLLLATVFIIKSGFPALAKAIVPPAPIAPPTKELRYCPKCGAPVSPEDVYCGSCGRKLK